MAARNGEYAVKGKRGKGYYIILSTDPVLQEHEREVCRTLGLKVEQMEVSLAARGEFEPRMMIGPLARQTAEERRRQINDNVNRKMHPPKDN